MKEADADWLVYHAIPEGLPATIQELAARTGLGCTEIGESICRLERFCLVERNGDSVRMLSFGEALLRNQVKYEPDLPFTIENGVIREKRKAP